jgi:hypothetical protein
MEPDRLAALHPSLYHMADARNYASIERHGLLSTSALLDRLGVSGDARVPAEAAHRPETLALPGPDGTVFVRDQHPLEPAALAACLDDLTLAAWYRTLNARVFFWPTRDRLERMLGAYGRSEQAIFEVDTRALLARYADEVELSHINSGYAGSRYPAARRGRHTFVPLRDYVYSAKNKIAEVTVPGAVPDIFELARRVTFKQGRSERVLWEARGS